MEKGPPRYEDKQLYIEHSYSLLWFCPLWQKEIKVQSRGFSHAVFGIAYPVETDNLNTNK